MKKIVTTIVMSMALAVAAYATSAHADDTRGICRLAGKYAYLAAQDRHRGWTKEQYLADLKDIDKDGIFFYLQDLVGGIVYRGPDGPAQDASEVMRGMCVDDPSLFIRAYRKGQM